MLNKTLDEIAQTGAQLYQGYQNAVQSRWNAPGQAAPVQTPPYGYQPAPAAPSAFQAPSAPELPKHEDWLANPAEATKRYADYLQATQFAPQLQQQAAAMAKTNRQLAQMQRADEFKRWGPEIDMTLNQMAPNPTAWTTDNILAVVDMVKARHVNELIAEERAKYTNELGGTSVRPSGSPGATSQMGVNQVDFEKLPPGYKDALNAKGVTQRVIDEFLERTYVKSGMEPNLDKARERWIKQVQRGDVFSDFVTVESPVYTSGA